MGDRDGVFRPGSRVGCGTNVCDFVYRRFSLPVAVLGGIGAAVGGWALELVTSANYAMSVTFNVIYLSTMCISGALLAGALGFVLVRGLAATGALDRFAVGRERQRLV